MADRFALALSRADHFQTLDLALRWKAALPVLASTDPGATRLALNQMIDLFLVYRAAWVAHLPASRWDPDFGDEIESAQRSLRALPTEPPAPGLPPWVAAVLARRYEAAVSAAVDAAGGPADARRAGSALERAVARVLAQVCTVAGENAHAETLERWSSAPI